MREGIFIFLFGLCVGSFLNVCIYRLPRQLSLVKPSSFCPKCKVPIKWYDNIPLISFLILRGRCRNCRGRISFRYFLVEALTGLVFLFTYVKLGLSIISLKYIVLFSFCIVVSFIDIDYRAIPGWVCVFGMVLGLSFALIESFLFLKEQDLISLSLSKLPLIQSFLGLFLCIGLSYFLKLMGDFFLWIYLTLKKKDSIEGEKEALGLGDVDFLGMVGAFLGWELGFLVFFLAPIVSLVYGIYIIVFKKSHLIAYLPFLSIAVFIASFWGLNIIKFFFPF